MPFLRDNTRKGFGIFPFGLMVIVFFQAISFPGQAQETSSATGPQINKKAKELEVTAKQITFDQDREEYRAKGSVVITQGPLRVTADQAVIHKLSGNMTAEGHVHLRDRTTDVWSERLSLNVNTEQGVITNGTVHFPESNTWIRGRLLQKFSETHYRAKDGSFTTCHAEEGEIPDWRFSYHDLDLERQDGVFARGVWLEVRNVPILPLPGLRYPLPGARKTGFLFPTVGVDNVFGFQYRQGFYWAITPSQDMTITPQILTDRGFGADLEYRYVLDRRSKGKWLISTLRDTVQDRTRAQIRGTHIQRPNSTLSIQMKVNYATDRSFLKDLSSSSAFRALPSQESLLNINQRLDHGNIYLNAQYLQPLDAGGKRTFQRLPEVGYQIRHQRIARSPLQIGMNSQFVHYFREEGFDVGRVDLVPHLSLEGLHLGHVVGFRPQLKLREVVYSHGRQSNQNDIRSRETLWAAMEARSSLSRRFSLDGQGSLRHTIEPRIMYEYVPRTKQSDLVQIDAVDDLIKKHLVTYSVNTRLTEEGGGGQASTWLDLFLLESYHLENPPGQAKKFSDIWGRLSLNGPAEFVSPFTRMGLTVDTFFDPNREEFSRVNSSIQVQSGKHWYVDVGHRLTRGGVVPRQGDLWNPTSLNEVLAPQSRIDFLTAGGAVRLPFGWTVGTKVYHDLAKSKTAEWDVVGLYQNPCRCWSLGLYYIHLGGNETVAKRDQFNFVLTLRGVGATPGLGTEVIRSLLGPLLGNEPGVPWSPR